MASIRKYLRNRLPYEHYKMLRRVWLAVATLGRGHDLEKLGRICGTDKALGHHYLQHYKAHFRKFKYRKVNLLEIGVGGYDDPMAGGNSLLMWRRYFPFGRIFSLDIYDKSALREPRIMIYRGSQVDEAFLDGIDAEAGGFDIIIDDGSHINRHVVETFGIMFPKLKDGGIYVVEDTQTSYWEEYGGDSNDFRNPATMMNFFKGLADSLNNKEFLLPGYRQSYYDKKVTSIHFYHNLVFIYKGNNDEESNIVRNNEMPVRTRS